MSQPNSRDRTWTILEILQWTTGHLKEQGIDAPRLDAEVLLAHSLGMSRLDLYLNYEKPLSPDERVAFREYVKQRAQERIPVSLLTGQREFWSLTLKVTGDVLTPRADTEVLVSAALDAMPDLERPYRVLDLGTGSGAIALAIASERPAAQVAASDVSVSALKVARENADLLQLNDRVRFAEGSLFAAVPGETFDLVVSNPPYVAGSERASLARELSHEPELALFGGEDGYAVLEPLIRGVGTVLNDGGLFLVELDPRQADTAMQWCREAGLCRVTVLHDLAGRERAVSAGKGANEKEHAKEMTV
ncbi:MAG: peptide chain release factor N(5)-glutamine methyltransferase [bacterium]|nr:peptide chain release factor N(5)-glutamine methyltransferase [bacterium]